MRSWKIVVSALCALLAMSSLACALVKIDVDLSTQTMHVTTRDGGSYDWPISSGRAGHLTPQGRFRPMRLYPIVYSSKYNNAPMPHSIFFYGQFAIHGTNAIRSLGRPASHGCIRLAPGNAAMLYAKVRSEGASISIVGAAPVKSSSLLPRRNRRDATLAYAPRHRTRSLREWSVDPIGAY